MLLLGISSTEEELARANIGDAQFVSSNVVKQNEVEKENENKNEIEEVKTNKTGSNSENIKENKTSEEANAKNIDDSEYFSKSKLERDTIYSQMLESYEKILNSTNSLEIQKQSASEEIKKINNIKNSIMICENLILIKGFDNCVIFVNNDNVSIIVKESNLTKEKVAQIQNIISREMNIKIENIHISNK